MYGGPRPPAVCDPPGKQLSPSLVMWTFRLDAKCFKTVHCSPKERPPVTPLVTFPTVTLKGVCCCGSSKHHLLNVLLVLPAVLENKPQLVVV